MMDRLKFLMIILLSNGRSVPIPLENSKPENNLHLSELFYFN